MDFFATALAIVVAYGSLIVVAWGFIDAYGYSKEDFKVVNRMPRLIWLMILLVGFGLLVFGIGGSVIREPLSLAGLTWLAVMVATGVYFYDQRPKLRSVRAGRLNT